MNSASSTERSVRQPFILGLTGSIGMGKTTTATMFRKRGVAVYDADAVVHALYANEAVPVIARLHPEAVVDGRVNRARLGAAVLGQPDRLAALEAAIHPLVRARELASVAQARSDGRDIIVLDVPLLFETGGDVRCDAVVVVSAAPAIQRARVLARPGMTEERLAAILLRQMPDTDKRARADFVVETDRGLDHAGAQVDAILATVRARQQQAEQSSRDP